MRTKLIDLGEGQELRTREDLEKVIIAETDKRIFDLEREPAALVMHPATWEKIEHDSAGVSTWNHFRDILVIRDTAIPRGQLSMRWKKPA